MHVIRKTKWIRTLLLVVAIGCFLLAIILLFKNI